MRTFKQSGRSHPDGCRTDRKPGCELFVPAQGSRCRDTATTTLAAVAALLIATFCAPPSHAQDAKKGNVDPTWLSRDTATAPEKPSDITTATCHYKPLFGEGDPDSPPITTGGSVLASVARYGEAAGADGIELRRPAKPGDAYFYRANATVGYYSAPGVRSRILCVRSWHPGMAPKKIVHPDQSK